MRAYPKKSSLYYLLVSVVMLINLYLVISMYAQGEYLFALVTLTIISSGMYIFSTKKMYNWRYVYPGMMGMLIFIMFPLVATVGIAFTNYSNKNHYTFERAVDILLAQQYPSGDKFAFQLVEQEKDQWYIYLQNRTTHEKFLTASFSLEQAPTSLNAQRGDYSLPQTNLKTVVKHRNALSKLRIDFDTGESLSLVGLRDFQRLHNRYTFDKSTGILTDQEKNLHYRVNQQLGFFAQIDENGQMLAQYLEPGFIVSKGFGNFIKIFTDSSIQKPFVQIFIWTVLFSLLTVFLTLALGMVLATLVSWEALRGRALYRMLLILPYAVPAFISILVFKGLFNQSFGEINALLEYFFGIKPRWFDDPLTAKAMILIVNTWLGYPYMMILCMGLLKAIPQDLYEASAIDGASTWQNFTHITLPLLLKPLTPLLIASFAFNFNNFVLIQLLTSGRPDIIGTTTPAGHTDLLVSYTYRIAFEGSGTQDFGLAAAIATIIFLLVGTLALLNLKATQLKVTD